MHTLNLISNSYYFYYYSIIIHKIKLQLIQKVVDIYMKLSSYKNQSSNHLKALNYLSTCVDLIWLDSLFIFSIATKSVNCCIFIFLNFFFCSFWNSLIFSFCFWTRHHCFNFFACSFFFRFAFFFHFIFFFSHFIFLSAIKCCFSNFLNFLCFFSSVFWIAACCFSLILWI